MSSSTSSQHSILGRAMSCSLNEPVGSVQRGLKMECTCLYLQTPQLLFSDKSRQTTSASQLPWINNCICDHQVCLNKNSFYHTYVGRGGSVGWRMQIRHLKLAPSPQLNHSRSATNAPRLPTQNSEYHLQPSYTEGYSLTAQSLKNKNVPNTIKKEKLCRYRRWGQW